MTRKDWMQLSIVGVVSFVLFEVVLDYLAYALNLPHRAWAPGIAIGLAAVVVLIVRARLRRGAEKSAQR